jgi:hypothetical protein
MDDMAWLPFVLIFLFIVSVYAAVVASLARWCPEPVLAMA